jgi:hypothetical protein
MRRHVAALNDPEALTFVEERQQLADREAAEYLAAIESETYYSGGLAVMYLVSGRK